MVGWKNANVNIIFIDTGAFAGKFNLKDPYRAKILPCFTIADQSELRLVTSNAVVYEAYSRIIYDTKGNINVCLDFLKTVFEGKINVLRVTHEDELMAREKIKKYKDIKKLTLIDALTSVLMEKNNIIKVFTTDYSHFSSMNFLTIPPVENLLQYLDD
jgi:predicted nucleic acid-binding protein